MSTGAVRRRTVLVEALRRPGLRRLCLVSAAFQISEWGAWIAVTTVAHGRGGVNEASAVVVAQLAPAAVAALFVDRLASRLGGAQVLVGGLVVQSSGLLVLAVLVAADAPSLAIYGAAVVAAVAVVTSRPTIAALLVEVVDDPHELTAANAVIGWLEGSATFVGPAITALGFALIGMAAPFLAFGLLTLAAALVAAGLRQRERAVEEFSEVPEEEVEEPEADEQPAASGWRDIGPLLAVLAAHAFIIGALDLLFVVVAIDITDGPPARAGLLNSMFGVGALFGAGGSVLLIGRRRLWPAVVLAGAVASAMLAVVGASTAVGFAALALAGCGLGAAALSVSARTLLQRVSDLKTLCRAFSLAESCEMAMLLVGTITVPLLVATMGARLAPLGVAALGAVVLVVASRPMIAAEGRFAAPLERLAAIRAVDIFSVLDAPTLETLARQAVHRSVAPGVTVVTQGEPGDDFFVITHGLVSVAIDGAIVNEMGPGEGFGELALIHDIPRTATVVALQPTELLAIDRRTFLVAVSGNPAAAMKTYEDLASAEPAT